MPEAALPPLKQQLDALPQALQARLQQRGFQKTQLLAWAASMAIPVAQRNQLQGPLQPPPPGLIDTLPDDPEAAAPLRHLGEAALRRGEVAICVLAGGMATRMGGVVKALVELQPGHSFLDRRLAEQQQLHQRYGHAPPLWLMTSEPTDAAIRHALAARPTSGPVATFEQLVSLRLTPEGQLFRDRQGRASVYATGHGDLPEALERAALLRSFQRRGGKYLWISNIDNLGASVDPRILGSHIQADQALTVELVAKHPGDRGGGPVLHRGRGIIAESFRLPADFDASLVPVFNTNTFLVSVDALIQLDMPWTYLQVQKTVDKTQAVKFERLLGELTMGLATHFLHVPREGRARRFLPVKTKEDLKQIKKMSPSVS